MSTFGNANENGHGIIPAQSMSGGLARRRFADTLPDAVDVAIIGGGIIGVATGYFLAGTGSRVLICEKGRVSGEQSRRNWGWIRQQGRDAAELPIMMEANRIWRGLAAETGERDLTFTQSGCLYVGEKASDAQKFELWHDLARSHQLDTRLLSRRAVTERLPDTVGRWSCGMLTPGDGRAEPFVAVPALARAAQARGARVIEDCAVRCLDIEGGRVTGIVTESGRVRAGRVLLAGGAWSSLFAGRHDIHLAQLIVRSTVARTMGDPAAPSLAGGLNVALPGLCFRRRADGGYSLAGGDLVEHYPGPDSFRNVRFFLKLLASSARQLRLLPVAQAGYPGSWCLPRHWSGDDISPFERQRILNPPPSRRAIRRLSKAMARRWPGQAGSLNLVESWAGMIDVTPDAVPILGPQPGLDGLYIATGLSGHGFGIGPAIGRIMADLMRDRPPGHDLHRFRPTRFSDGSPIMPGPY